MALPEQLGPSTGFRRRGGVRVVLRGGVSRPMPQTIPALCTAENVSKSVVNDPPQQLFSQRALEVLSLKFAR
jgi:hypothetical protein